MSFANLGLSDALVRAVGEAGYTQPTPIQAKAIPIVLTGADLLAGAQTGTGKTAAFVLPMLQRLGVGGGAAPAGDAGRRAPARKIRALILTPTRELAAQVEESVRTYGKHSDISSCVIFGGVSINPQIDRLRRGVDILVATPGRLLDHCGQRTIDLSAVEILVLDEADRMLDMGFIPDIKRILAILPKRRQNLLFSATFAEPIRALASSLLVSPQQVQVTPSNSTVDTVKQTVHPVDAGRKAELLVHLVKEGNWFQVLVFTRTKHGANKLAARLEKSGVPALAIHGNKSQNARTRALADFKAAKLQVLVATDIAARGLDIEQLPHVVNFELPHVPEDYVHRIGRTGRAGATGEAVSLVSGEEHGRLRDIERVIRRSLPRVTIPGFEPGRPGAQPAEVIESDERPARRPTPRAAPRSSARPSHHASPSRSAGGASRGTPARTGSHERSPAAGGSGERNRAAEGNRSSAPSFAGHPGKDGAARPGAARFERNGPGSGAHGGGRSADRRGGARGHAEAPSNVRSNLPPGWTVGGAPARRGR
jgi:ATP-dependent RNA helicase RhlE